MRREREKKRGSETGLANRRETQDEDGELKDISWEELEGWWQGSLLKQKGTNYFKL